MNKLDMSRAVAYMENGTFIQFVEWKGAEVIMKSAEDAGLKVVDRLFSEGWFDIVEES